MYLNHDESVPKMWAFRVMLRGAMQVLAGSADIAAFLGRRLAVPTSKTIVVPCGILPDAFAAQPQINGSAGPVIITVGRLVPHKGHRVLLDAFARVVDHIPGASLHIVGDGPERGSLDRHARASGLADRVRFLGTCYPTTEVLGRADLFVLPSLVEPQGLALLEAYARSVPAVASRTGGIVEMLEHDVDGLLVRPGDPDDLASAILRMLTDATLRQRCSEHARLRLADFDVRAIAERYVQIYDDISPGGAAA